MGAGVGAATGAATRGFDMAAAVGRLVALAANKRATRSRPEGTCEQRIGPLVLSTLADWPEPSPAWTEADKALKGFADELAVIGGVDLMVELYDETVERHGYHAVAGVSASWSGRHGWWH
jgi:hypothetical protein